MSDSNDISKQNPLDIAAQAEQDLNSYEAKTGHQQHVGGRNPGGLASDSTLESGVNEGATRRFAEAGATVNYGSSASGAGDNREIPVEEGGEINPETGRQTKARDFEGVGGPEEKMKLRETERPGDQDVIGNIRDGGYGEGSDRRS